MLLFEKSSEIRTDLILFASQNARNPGSARKNSLIQFANVLKNQMVLNAEMSHFDFAVTEVSAANAAANSIHDMRVIVNDAYEQTRENFPIARMPVTSAAGMTLSSESVEYHWNETEATATLGRASEALSGNRSSLRDNHTTRRIYMVNSGFTIPGTSLLDSTWKNTFSRHIDAVFHACLETESAACVNGDMDLLLWGSRNMPTIGRVESAKSWGGTTDAEYLDFIEYFINLVNFFEVQFNMRSLVGKKMDCYFPGEIYDWLVSKSYPNDMKEKTCWDIFVERYKQLNFIITNELNHTATDAASVFMCETGQLKRFTVTPEPYFYAIPMGRDIRVEVIQQVGGMDVLRPQLCRRIEIPAA